MTKERNANFDIFLCFTKISENQQKNLKKTCDKYAIGSIDSDYAGDLDK